MSDSGSGEDSSEDNSSSGSARPTQEYTQPESEGGAASESSLVRVTSFRRTDIVTQGQSVTQRQAARAVAVAAADLCADPAPCNRRKGAAKREVQNWFPSTEYGPQYYTRSKWFGVRASRVPSCGLSVPRVQPTAYTFRAQDIVQIGTHIRGETKTSVWTITMQKRQTVGQKKNATNEKLSVSVEDVVELDMAPGEPFVLLDVKGWPEKKEPK